MKLFTLLTPISFALYQTLLAHPVADPRAVLSIDLGGIGDLLPTATVAVLFPTGIELLPSGSEWDIATATASTYSFARATDAVDELSAVSGISGLEGFSNITEALDDVLNLIKGDLPLNSTDTIVPMVIEFFVNVTEVLSNVDLSSSDTETEVDNALDVISGILAATTDLVDVMLADNTQYDENEELAKLASELKSALDLFVSGVQGVLNNELFRLAVVLIVKYLPLIIAALATVV